MIALLDSLRLPDLPRVAFVGGGGKTSAMFALGRQLAARFPAVLLTTTTHLGVEQPALADLHLDHTPQDLTQLRGVVLISGGETGHARVAGPSEADLESLMQRAGQAGLPLLVEADGARCLPLKAPAIHEPVIPGWANVVINVAGLSGLGAVLDEHHVQRAQLFSELSGLALGQAVSVEALARVMTHPQGGLKNVPPGAQRVALLNQADTVERQAAARRLSAELLPTYHRVVAASVNPPAPAPAGVWAVYEPVAGVVLAAGQAQRMGRLKQLMMWRGRPFVTQVAQTALDAGLWPVVVVTGCQAEAVEAALAGLPVQIVDNPRWQEGQGASVAVGVQALPANCGSAVFMLVDQPHIPAALVSGLVDLHVHTLAGAVAPMVDGQRANPVLFDRRTFADLSRLQGEMGGRALFSRYPPAWLPWIDANAALDVDTPADYQRLLDQDDAP